MSKYKKQVSDGAYYQNSNRDDDGMSNFLHAGISYIILSIFAILYHLVLYYTI